jgi:UDP-3-O-[3-hydroxymyristoyl] glucosamine N-acyltransferase
MLTFAGSASFVKRAIANPALTCIVTTSELVDLIPAGIGVLTASNPKETFFRLHNWIANSTNFFADDRPTTVAASATVHPTAWIDPRGVTVSDDCVIGANVVINGPATIGTNTAIDAGTVIGSAAFQTSGRTGPYVELEHVGGVQIGMDCHIYSNASIARGVFRASTRIGDRCQIGNGAFVSHQCQLGNNVFVGHNATVNGRVVVGDEVWIGPGAVISNELTIGARAHIALGSTVIQPVPENARVAGIPALEQHTMFRHAATIRSKRR